MTEDEILQRGVDAQRLLINQTFVEVINTLTNEHVEKIVHSDFNDADGREQAFRAIRAYQLVETELQARVMQAQAILDERDKQQTENTERG